MAPAQRTTVKEHLFWAYANLTMAHMTLSAKQEKYSTVSYMVRSKSYKSLLNGDSKVRSIFDDEKVKISLGKICNYCRSKDHISLDHILPQKSGGKDHGDNLIYACRPCNSSKGKKDLMEWMQFRGEFLPLLVIRRYLKLAMQYCIENDLMDLPWADPRLDDIPYKLALLPLKYPPPNELQLD